MQSLPAAVMSVWGDPKTGLPVRVEATMAIMPDMKLTMSDFAFNVDMDESLFSVEPPAGYEVTAVDDHTIDGSPIRGEGPDRNVPLLQQMERGPFPRLAGHGVASSCGQDGRSGCAANLNAAV